MDALSFFKLDVVGNSLKQAILTEAKQFRVSLAWTKLSVGTRLDGVLLLSFICCVLVKRIVRSSVSSVWKVERHGEFPLLSLLAAKPGDRLANPIFWMSALS